MIIDRSQRWRERQSLFRPAAEPFYPRRHDVAVITAAQAAAFVAAHHAQPTTPPTRLCVGLFDETALAGVAVFSVSCNEAVGPKYTGLDARLTAELGRFVLLDEVPGNGETWFARRALRVLRREKPEIEAVVSYSDPLRSRAPDGTVLQPGHVGRVYALLGAAFRGRAAGRTAWTTPAGAVVSERAITKLRAGDVGRDYAERQLRSAGAPPPERHETAADWLRRLESAGLLRRTRRPGNLVYAWPLTLAARLAARPLPALPYPRFNHDAWDGDVVLAA